MDQRVFSIPRNVATQSNLIKNMLDLLGESETPIKLTLVDSETLEQVILYCTKLLEAESDCKCIKDYKKNPPTCKQDIWAQEYLRSKSLEEIIPVVKVRPIFKF